MLALWGHTYGLSAVATAFRWAENLPGELLTPAAVELVIGLATEAAQLVLELARESAQLVLGLVADLTENSFLSSGHLLLLSSRFKLTHSEFRPRGPKSLALASARQRTRSRKWLILR